jgi:phosphodiesterase/alkaline phosphatase D-like protein
VYHDGGPLAVWGAEKKASRKAACTCSADQEAQTDAWYFKHYCEWFSGADVREAMASIPSINIWDDHDLVVRRTCSVEQDTLD